MAVKMKKTKKMRKSQSRIWNMAKKKKEKRKKKSQKPKAKNRKAFMKRRNEPFHRSFFPAFPQRISENPFHPLPTPLRSILSPYTVSAARCTSSIGTQFPTTCDLQLTKSNFQTHAGFQEPIIRIRKNNDKKREYSLVILHIVKLNTLC